MNVAIIGAGPAGCTLARLLLLHQQHHASPPPEMGDSSPPAPGYDDHHRRQLSVAVFETDQAPDFRAQGGTLDLHPSTGLAALRAAGLYDEFLAHARYDGESFRLCDKTLKTYIRVAAGTAPSPAAPGADGAQQQRREQSARSSSRGAPEIDRAELRSMLVRALPDGTVRWGWRLEAVETDTPQSGSAAAAKSEPSQPSYTLRFDRQRTAGGFDLVVGADGAWSCVRPFLAPFSSADAPAWSHEAAAAAPVFSGVAGFRFTIPDAARAAPALYELVDRGSLFAFSDGKALTVQQLGNGSIWVGATGVQGEDWARQQQLREQHVQDQQRRQHEQAAHDTAKRQQLPSRDRNRVGAWFKGAVRVEYKGWAPELLNVIDAAEDTAVPSPIYMLPPGFRWRSKPGITLIGDAAHLTVPFAGEGVNIALEDALKLSHAIIAALNVTSGRSRGTDIRQVLASKMCEFEANMFARARAVQAMSVGMMRAMFFTPGAPRTSIHTYISWKAWQLHPLLRALVAAAVWIYFAVWKLFN